MALILNIETATSVCSVAISKNGQVIAFEESHESNVHAERLLTFIQNTVNKAGLSLNNMDAIAIGSGPGSYTGLRIGTSTAKGLCYALDKPLIAISTLKAMAQSAQNNSILNTQFTLQLFCPMIDARRLEVYTALYDTTGKEVLPVNAKILDETSFSEYLKNHAIAFFGDGMPKMKTIFPAPNPNMIFFDDITASANNMATLSEEAFNKKDFADLAYYEPFYLKDFVAKKKAVN
ncbi:MAG TPA: tRNA (adenosine(37)-N6)-threonylcarbamoyltransferase complex dimerization subunit type 1 TsaB [Bacteroidia bacterium]|jgi:tRNA threonylcarbamoyladenosine biosynthesis protein TsaB|nr:tRNA (adenosine(37)-N6)-threonylcarbamoyltransferase complex dimerization subunit type 1 TsaB [Bacteroidia bacterium]